jgi:predicted transcriptional regulator
MSSSLSLSPTARMILHILGESQKPLSKMELVTATGASLYTVVPLIQLLARKNLVSRTIVGKTAYYSLLIAADQGGQ